MEAAIEEVSTEEAPKLGKLSDRLCVVHGLHFNPVLSKGCARCKEGREQERQARLALLIVAFVLFAVVTVMVHATWMYFQDSGSLKTSQIQYSSP